MKSPKNDMILRVAVATPLYSLFDYLPPIESNITNLSPGTRIEIPFAKGKRLGVLIETVEESGAD